MLGAIFQERLWRTWTAEDFSIGDDFGVVLLFDKSGVCRPRGVHGWYPDEDCLAHLHIISSLRVQASELLTVALYTLLAF